MHSPQSTPSVTRDAPDRVSPGELAALRELVETRQPRFLRDLETLVNIDCGSYTKHGVDEVGRWTASYLEQLGATVRRHPNAELGDTIVGNFAGRQPGSRLLLIGHLDTVFPVGTVVERPFRVEGGRAFGPGVTDMKSGLLAGLYALEVLRETLPDGWPFERLVFIANPDEEIGSPVSSPLIREAARDSHAALVLECARANGDIVSSRKGVVDLRLVLRGRAAHAGVEPEKGRSAILEAAHKIVGLHQLPDRHPGITCNVGVVSGGTRPNVVAEQVTMEVDLRSPTRAGLEAAEADLRVICATSTVPDVTCEIEERNRHWPMEKLEASIRLVEHAQALATGLGFNLDDAATGGASDANTTSGMGIPTLDGLGPVGGNDHSPLEYLEIGSIVPRVTLLAGLILAISRDGREAGVRAS